MAKTPSRLGRGLNTLIGGNRSEAVPPSDTLPEQQAPARHSVPRETESAAGYRMIDPMDIRPNPHQPRTEFSEEKLRELCESIQRQGLLQPVVVRKVKGDRGFELIAGERRLRAAKLAGIGEIPAIVRDATDEQSMEIALIENLQREDLGPLERAAAYESIMKVADISADQLAARLGESRPSISNHLRLLKLPEEIRELLRIGELAMGQARAIAGVTDERRQIGLARLAVRRNLSVRQVEALAKGASGPVEGEIASAVHVKSAEQRHAENLAREISRQLGLPVRLISGRKKNSGKILIQYKSLDEFDQFAERIGIVLRD
ncbi:MAG: ParB/RepB/Spo0J family partition protein [Phycisphaerae bacterium]